MLLPPTIERIFGRNAPPPECPLLLATPYHCLQTRQLGGAHAQYSKRTDGNPWKGGGQFRPITRGRDRAGVRRKRRAGGLDPTARADGAKLARDELRRRRARLAAPGHPEQSDAVRRHRRSQPEPMRDDHVEHRPDRHTADRPDAAGSGRDAIDDRHSRQLAAVCAGGRHAPRRRIGVDGWGLSRRRRRTRRLRAWRGRRSIFRAPRSRIVRSRATRGLPRAAPYSPRTSRFA